MKIWEKIYEIIQQECKLFLFILGVISLFRIAFIGIMHSYISESAAFMDIWMSLYYGVRISLKSAGLLTLVSFASCIILSLIQWRWRMNDIRLFIGSVYITVLSGLFYARIPYYEQFHMAFNQLIFNTLQDDVYALLLTLIEQFNLPERLIMAVGTAWLLRRLLKSWLAIGVIHLPQFSKWYYTVGARAAFLLAIYYLTIFIRFGGSMTYAQNVDWENSGVTKDQLLNEAVLDDMQALYRAYELHERLRSSTGLDIDPTRMAEYGAHISGQSVQSGNLDNYLHRTAQGANVTKPKHVFLIVAESYANWPLLPQYQNLNIANGVRAIISQPDAAYVSTFLPNGMSTISGVLGVVTGFTDSNLYLNCMPEAYKEPYPTAIATQMKRLGYKPKFWYAGPGSWERIRDFTLAQGFEEFHGSGDYPSPGGNVWGGDDRYLFQAVYNDMKGEPPSFNVVLNVSNHSPYTVDLAAEGFDEASVVQGLPDELKKDKELIKKLGHFWYADKMIAEFIAKTRSEYPDSLFLIVGDHADRLNLEANPGMYERYGIPFIVYGQGVSKDIFPDNAAGSHINVIPTLMELIAPAGFDYYAVGTSLTRGNALGMNYGFWITRDYIGRADTTNMEPVYGRSGAKMPDRDAIEYDITALRAVSCWRIQKGPEL